jgi:DNA-binding transcriptional LysR family regulator
MEPAMTLDIRHIRVVLAVADEGTLTKASSRLGIPQSALSTQLNRIERAAGARLFVRTSRGASPTEWLERLMPQLRAVDLAMLGLEGALQHTGSRPGAQFEIGLASPDFADPLAAVCGSHSALESATFLVTTADACIRKLCDDQLAFVHSYGTPLIPVEHRHNLRAATIAEEVLGVLLPQEHRLARHDGIRLIELADELWISYPLRSEQHGLLSAVCEVHGFVPRIRYHAATELAARDLVRDRSCVTIGSPNAARAGIVVRPLDIRLTRRLVAIWNLSKCPHAVAHMLCTTLQHWYREHQDG